MKKYLVTLTIEQREELLQMISIRAFGVDDVQKEYERLTSLGVKFTMKPRKMGPATMAVFDDTCGNLIQIAQKD